MKRQAFTRPERISRVQRKRDGIVELPFNLDPASLGTCKQAFDKDPGLSDVAKRVLRSALQSGTISNYEGVVRDFKTFTLDQGYGEVPTENNVSHFLLYLEKHSVTDSYISKVKAALTMYEEMLNVHTTAFTKPVTRILDGVKNLAISRKAPVKKAARLSLHTIRKMVERVIIPYVSTPERAEAKQLRTVFRVTVVYYTFCRFNCFSTLRAENFLDRGSEIEVFFPRAKNDVKHRGNITKMVQNGTTFCPVFITRFYFRRFGFLFGNQDRDRRFVNCRLRKVDNTWNPQSGVGLSQTTATEQLRALLTQLGVCAEGVTDKSVKMEGVTRMLDAGAAMIDVANQGRWKTVEIIQTYKHNSDRYKRETASQIPFV